MTVNWEQCITNLLIKTGSPYTLSRPDGAGTFTKGVYTESSYSNTTITANIQPANGIELEQLPEGRHNRDTIRIYTTDEIRTANEDTKTQPDIVVYDSKNYQVDKVWVWDVHYKALATELDR